MTDTSRLIADQIQSRLNGFHPQTALILGSGLGSLADNINPKIVIPYSEINGFPQTTVAGHQGALIIGRLGSKDVLCLQGRFHLYEGHAPQTVLTVISALKLIGIENLILTNAAGSLKTDMPPGSLMLITDHINFSGRNPLVGPNDDSLGPRFPDLSNAYDSHSRELLHNLAHKHNIKLFDGVYLMVLGPNFETPAEIRAFQILGADAVGMSTVPEVLAAVYAGIRTIALSVITNYGTGMQTAPQSHHETLDQAQHAAAELGFLIQQFIEEI